METIHRILVGDARSLDRVADDAVDLVVTSPPYPMIEMWDDLFRTLDPAVGTALDAGDGPRAYESMHGVLDDVWDEVGRVLVDGGIACVNVGDATRRLGDHFRVYRNHDRIARAFEERGFDPLPDVLWRKPVNSGTKFMGSGMLPPNAYVTLEHEFVLLFRNGPDARHFEPRSERRYRAAYFWEERNRWFSDVWTDIGGEFQALDGDAPRERSGAFPFTLPHRLINMYSVYGDTVLDPFWGTGTTTLAAMVACRNSVGYELDGEFVDAFDDRASSAPALSRDVCERRLDAHESFVERRRAEGRTFEYVADAHDVPVTTSQERRLQLYRIRDIERDDGNRETTYAVHHDPFERDGRTEDAGR